MSVTVVICPRCREEVAFGAPWRPHCGRDMTVHAPIESVHSTKYDPDQRAVATLDAVILGVGSAAAFGVIEAGLFAIFLEDRTRPMGGDFIDTAIRFIRVPRSS